MNQLKLIIFSDLHYAGGLKTDFYHRKLTGFAEPLLQKLSEAVTKFQPDAVIYLGDFIEDVRDHDQDLKNLRYIWDKMKKLPAPVYAIPGNHDLRSMYRREEVEEVLGFGHSTFSIDLNDYHLVFLGLDIDNSMSDQFGGILKTQYLSESDLNWLRDDLENNTKPCLVFNHFGLADDDTSKNWWFGSDGHGLFTPAPAHAFLNNRAEIKRILEGNPDIIAVFTGHQHWTRHLTENGIKYHVVGSMSEDINGNGKPDGVYFEAVLTGKNLSLTEKHLIV